MTQDEIVKKAEAWESAAYWQRTLQIDYITAVNLIRTIRSAIEQVRKETKEECKKILYYAEERHDAICNSVMFDGGVCDCGRHSESIKRIEEMK